ncbi:MAG: hypothetical protein ACI9GZ_003241, partial [Bacteroidia bacterium]
LFVEIFAALLNFQKFGKAYLGSQQISMCIVKALPNQKRFSKVR